MVNLVIIGHVDSGKSTMTGHLLFLLGKVNPQTMHKYEKMSLEYGKGSFKFAWVMDEGEEERKRGVTIDVG
jgi:translation elongation factor EF-1alpha